MRKRFLLSLILSAVFTPQLFGQDAFTVPRSNKVIYGQLAFPDGSKVNFVTRDGMWVTVEDRTGFYGFQGIVVNEKTTNFNVHKIIRTVSPTGEVRSATEEIFTPRDIPVGASVRYQVEESARHPQKAGSVRLRPTAVGEWAFALAPIEDPSQLPAMELLATYGVSGNGICCVTCNYRTICANSVTTSCGSCEGGGGGALEY